MKVITLYIAFFFSSIGFSQQTLSELLKSHNTQSVSYMSVKELAMPKTKAILLDAREVSEYNVSHLKNAIHVGYDYFNIEAIKEKLTDKSATIVVYCSLGIRSEDVAEKLKKEGYTDVYNLYGGIFEWKNNNLIVYNSEEKVTENIHAFSKDWGKWLTKGRKTYNSKSINDDKKQ